MNTIYQMDANALAFFVHLNVIINSVRTPYLIVSSNLTPKVMLAQIKKAKCFVNRSKRGF